MTSRQKIKKYRTDGWLNDHVDRDRKNAREKTAENDTLQRHGDLLKY